MAARSYKIAIASLGALLGCNAPEPPGITGGTDVPAGACGRGVVVVGSDYQSTNVGLMDWDGALLSASLVSSASASSGLSAPLSGDVVSPTMARPGAPIVLVDRFPASVITWLDPTRGEVKGQLSVATGFAANPQDYVEVSPRKAYVPRLEPNFDAGAQPFDGGSDLLVVDPEARAVVGRVDLAPAMAGEDAKFLARPGRAALVGDRLYVLLAAYSLSFLESAASRVVEIDTRADAIASVTVLDGLHGCTALAASASGARLAVGCSGTFQGSATSNLAEAGVAILAPRDGGLVEERRFTADEIGPSPPGFFLAFAADDRVLVTTFGREPTDGSAALPDTVTALRLDGGAPEVLLRSQQHPFTLGEIRCAEACGRCLVADAETDRGVVHRFDLRDGAIEHAGAFHADEAIGLPPRYLGAF